MAANIHNKSQDRISVCLKDTNSKADDKIREICQILTEDQQAYTIIKSNPEFSQSVSSLLKGTNCNFSNKESEVIEKLRNQLNIKDIQAPYASSFFLNQKKDQLFNSILKLLTQNEDYVFRTIGLAKILQTNGEAFNIIKQNFDEWENELNELWKNTDECEVHEDYMKTMDILKEHLGIKKENRSIQDSDDINDEPEGKSDCLII